TEAQPQVSEEFILQVGSFRRDEEADRLRAQLLLLNLDAYTEKVTLNNDQVWHRVLVGPFNSQSRLSNARVTLVSNEYNALVLMRQVERYTPHGGPPLFPARLNSVYLAPAFAFQLSLNSREDLWTSTEAPPFSPCAV